MNFITSGVDVCPQAVSKLLTCGSFSKKYTHVHVMKSSTRYALTKVSRTVEA